MSFRCWESQNFLNAAGSFLLTLLPSSYPGRHSCNDPCWPFHSTMRAFGVSMPSFWAMAAAAGALRYRWPALMPRAGPSPMLASSFAPLNSHRLPVESARMYFRLIPALVAVPPIVMTFVYPDSTSSVGDG